MPVNWPLIATKSLQDTHTQRSIINEKSEGAGDTIHRVNDDLNNAINIFSELDENPEYAPYDKKSTHMEVYRAFNDVRSCSRHLRFASSSSGPYIKIDIDREVQQVELKFDNSAFTVRQTEGIIYKFKKRLNKKSERYMEGAKYSQIHGKRG